MNQRELVASLVQSIASLGWPAAVFGSVYLFREELRKMLPLLRVKHKEIEVDFRMEQAAREAAELPTPPETPANEPTPEEQTRFEQLAKLAPNAAIMDKRLELQEVLYRLASKFVKGATRPTSILEATRLLRN